ncbi:short transient receptor potential channel 3, partial [Biomphalaria glabrata]
MVIERERAAMARTLGSCIAYNNSPYSSPSRGLDYGSADKRASAMPSQGSLFTNFEDVQ